MVFVSKNFCSKHYDWLDYGDVVCRLFTTRPFVLILPQCPVQMGPTRDEMSQDRRNSEQKAVVMAEHLSSFVVCVTVSVSILWCLVEI